MRECGGGGGLRTNKQRRNSSQRRQQQQQQTLEGTEHREQTHPRKVTPPPPQGARRLGGPTPNTEAGGTKKKKKNRYQLSNGLRNANCRLLNFVSRSRQVKRGNVHSLLRATTPPPAAVTRSVPPSCRGAFRPFVSRLSLNGNFLTRFHAPERAPNWRTAPNRRPRTNHGRPSTWGLRMLISGGPMAVAHTG